jgi:hypothetical protein
MLPLAEYWYTTSTSLGCTPFKILYEYDPVVSATPMLPAIENLSLQELLSEHKLHIELIKQHLLKAQNMIKMQANKNKTDREFQVGHQVLLKLQPYTQSSVASRPFPKLAHKFFQPYKILERIGRVAYRL